MDIVPLTEGRTGSFGSGNLPRREKLTTVAAVAVVASLSWAYLGLHATMGMADVPWSAGHVGLTLLMWAVMMVAMMLPSATPMVLAYRAIAARATPAPRRGRSAALFAAGYVLVWSGFSVGATVLQWGLHEGALLTSSLALSSPLLGGGLLILAGLYQWSSLKEFCLRQCQSPLTFFMRHWRKGSGGALRMGVQHGLYCVGCCWPLMLLLFVGGVMNLLWVAAISLFVLAEKLVPGGSLARGWISGGGLICAGAWVLTASY